MLLLVLVLFCFKVLQVELIKPLQAALSQHAVKKRSSFPSYQFKDTALARSLGLWKVNQNVKRKSASQPLMQKDALEIEKLVLGCGKYKGAWAFDFDQFTKDYHINPKDMKDVWAKYEAIKKQGGGSAVVGTYATIPVPLGDKRAMEKVVCQDPHKDLGTLTVDLSEKSNPDVVADMNTILSFLPDQSVESIVCEFPTALFETPGNMGKKGHRAVDNIQRILKPADQKNDKVQFYISNTYEEFRGTQDLSKALKEKGIKVDFDAPQLSSPSG